MLKVLIKPSPMNSFENRQGNNVKQSDKPILRDEKGRWLQGSGSPSPGRPVSSRQRISERLLADLAVVWEEHGKTVLERLAKDDPAKLATIAYGLLPRDVFVRVEDQRTPGNLESIRELLDILEAAGVKDPEDLRARLATEIAGFGSKAVATAYASNNEPESDQ
jgi:hypothetical protein